MLWGRLRFGVCFATDFRRFGSQRGAQEVIFFTERFVLTRFGLCFAKDCRRSGGEIGAQEMIYFAERWLLSFFEFSEYPRISQISIPSERLILISWVRGRAPNL